MERGFRPSPDWITEPRALPLAIAHRGASAHAFDNTLRAFQVARDIGADMWEVDVRLTADGVPVAFHDADLSGVGGGATPVGEVAFEQLVELTQAVGRPAPRFEDIAALAAACGAGIYLDAKEGAAATAAIDILLAHRIERAIVGANTPDYCAELIARGSPYPVSILVGLGKDPFAIADACGAAIVHPCWERAGDRPDQLLDAAFFSEAARRGLPVVTWHEERPDVLAALVEMPVLGICSDTPERVLRYGAERTGLPEIVCHRGICRIGPENTLAAIALSWSAGFDYAEIDVHESADGDLVVHHDDSLERTTSGTGALKDHSAGDLAGLDAGSHFDAFFANEPVPSLDQVLDEAVAAGGKLYVELKQADPLKVADKVLGRLPADRVFFWSWNADWLKRIAAAFPEARLMARPQDYDSLEACLSDFGALVIEFNAGNVTAEGIAAVRAAGRRAMIAYMGSDTGEIDRLARLGPDLLNVNHPFETARRLAAVNRER